MEWILSLNIVYQIVHDLEVSTGMLDKELDALKRDDVAPSRTKGLKILYVIKKMI